MINYPDGRKRVVAKKAATLDKRKTKNQTANERAYNSLVRSNMGMRFESEISKTCDFYRTKGIADIYKRPTPIKVVKRSKEHPGRISEAYFEEKSTTDYVGIYKGKYIDFECKETIHDSVPYHRIRPQQYEHLRFITSLGGIGFFLVSFKTYQKVFLRPAPIILEEVEKKHHPGFKMDFFAEKGVEVRRGYVPPYFLLEAIDEAFFAS